MRALSYLALGVLFAVGLGISGMTQPTKVIGFLDVAGNWDPALLFVMGAAVIVTFIGYRLVLRREAPVLGRSFDLPTRRHIDPALVGGAALFGVGWGLAGFCPGPAIVALASGSTDVLLFVGAMVAGFIARDLMLRPTPGDSAAAAV